MNAINSWQEQLQGALKNISKVLEPLGFYLTDEQPHVSGERYLMTKNKLVLMAKNDQGRKVVVKISNHPNGKTEIKREKEIRDILSQLSFAGDVILFPEEIYFDEVGDYLVWVTDFIAQDKVFVEHPTELQFFTILRAMESQEAFHATTFEHFKKVGNVFPVLHAKEYFAEFDSFKRTILNQSNGPELERTISQAEDFLKSHKQVIDKYCGYLSHTDFVAHNFRLKNRQIYMLDLSSIRFGSKHESWARLLNYMVIHNPKLEELLVKYLRQNRGEDEYLSLRLMRVFKICFLLNYYAESLPKTEGDLKKLTELRLDLWTKVLNCVLKDESVPAEITADYKTERDKLRSEDEKKRQREFAVA